MTRTLALLTLAAGLSACSPHTVDAGTIGVKTDWGAVQPEPLQEGFYWVSWLGEEINNINARVLKMEANSSASSKDLQVVTTKIALNFRIDPENVVNIFQSIGSLEEVKNNIIDPVLQEAVKTATARYNAEELITKRPQVKADITEYVTERLSNSNLIVTDLSIVNFQFDSKYQDAIEAKQVAEQRALTAQNDLRRIEVEAKQTEARAQGEANSALIGARAEAERQELLRRTITPELVQWQAIQRWNGVLPTVTGDDIPLIQLSAP
jgi:regulator of protease activity HflC (stomatin/prohibitin superfamily)